LAKSNIEDGNPHIPVLVNKKSALWFMDTGANISVMSDAVELTDGGMHLMAVRQEMQDAVAADKTRTACDQYPTHMMLTPNPFRPLSYLNHIVIYCQVPVHS